MYLNTKTKCEEMGVSQKYGDGMKKSVCCLVVSVLPHAGLHKH